MYLPFRINNGVIINFHCDQTNCSHKISASKLSSATFYEILFVANICPLFTIIQFVSSLRRILQLQIGSKLLIASRINTLIKTLFSYQSIDPAPFPR